MGTFKAARTERRWSDTPRPPAPIEAVPPDEFRERNPGKSWAVSQELKAAVRAHRPWEHLEQYKHALHCRRNTHRIGLHRYVVLRSVLGDEERSWLGKVVGRPVTDADPLDALQTSVDALVDAWLVALARSAAAAMTDVYADDPVSPIGDTDVVPPPDDDPIVALTAAPAAPPLALLGM